MFQNSLSPPMLVLSSVSLPAQRAALLMEVQGIGWKLSFEAGELGSAE